MIYKQAPRSKQPWERIYLFWKRKGLSKPVLIIKLLRQTFMRHPVKIYISASVICFLVLIVVQCILVYNTYELLNRRFYYASRSYLNQEYSRTILNDKVYPGGQRIIDSLLAPRMRYLEQLYHSNEAAFNTYSQQLLDSIFTRLVREQCADSLLRGITARGGITDSLHYLLSIQRVELAFTYNKYITIYDHHKHYPLINTDIQKPYGIHVYGNLQRPNEQNLVLGINVTDSHPYSYAISFSLHADPYNRMQLVLGQMRPILMLSLASLLTIITLFILTLRNWLKQKHLSDVKTDFINNITHEFHTPLTAIMVANKNIQNERVLENRETVRSLSEIIQRQSERLKLLFGRVLDLGTIDRLYVQRQPQELNALVQQVLDDYRLKLSPAGIQLSFEESGRPCRAAVDVFHFTTLLINLLDNAIKYNQQENKRVTVTLRATRQYAQLLIADNGIGMSRRTMKHVFDKFYRDQESTGQPVKGLGLGLYYVKQCIEAHHWQIQVESEPGRGSTFCITIPLEDAGARGTMADELPRRQEC